MTSPTHITVRVPLKIRRRPGRRTVVTPVVDGLPTHTATCADPALLKALARAFRYERMLDDGRYATISEMAAAEKLDRGYLGRLLQLTLLAPNVVGAILDGTQPAGLVLPLLLRPLRLEWEAQRAALTRGAHPAGGISEVSYQRKGLPQASHGSSRGVTLEQPGKSLGEVVYFSLQLNVSYAVPEAIGSNRGSLSLLA